ncbi:DUF7256 domain-containing protein [Pseudomonas synxantha]|uniref:DUF7256 domain-containing protein n=1 Tax=Pseudomonas synxantha TaxID=47883 RepID=UPI003D662F63
MATAQTPPRFRSIPIAPNRAVKISSGPRLRACVLTVTPCHSPRRLNCARLALLRSGDPLEQLQAALGASWCQPRPKDDGWWLVATCPTSGWIQGAHRGGFTPDVSVVVRNFSRRCAVEGLRIHMPLASALTRQPSLRKFESVSGPRRDVRHVHCHQGYHRFVHFYQARLWRLCLEAPDALHHS